MYSIQLFKKALFGGVTIAEIKHDAAVLAARKRHQDIVKLLETIGYAF